MRIATTRVADTDQISAGETLQPDVMRTTEIIFREQFFHEQIAAQTEGWRAEHRDQLRKFFRRGQHFLRFRQIVRHAGLAENVFAGFKRRDRHGRMHIRRRADPDDVEIGEGKEVGPIRHRRGVGGIFLAKFFRALVGGIRDRQDFDLGMFF